MITHAELIKAHDAILNAPRPTASVRDYFDWLSSFTDADGTQLTPELIDELGLVLCQDQ